jgi:GMP synthase (glutamine-hydrolysing)
MTGSPLSVTEPTEWMQRAAETMLEAGERGLPVLGVCFGHQLLASRLGAAVSRNPNGRELGTVEVQLTPEGRAHPLFHGCPERLEVQATHEDQAALPPGATLLATNTFCAMQAFAWGPRVLGVQFHPEMNAASIRFAIRAPEAKLSDAERAAKDEAAHDTPWGALMLQNFVTRF